VADQKARSRGSDDPEEVRGPPPPPPPPPPLSGAGAEKPGEEKPEEPAEKMIGGEVGNMPDLDAIDWGDDDLDGKGGRGGD
jgi:hypothetical protein